MHITKTGWHITRNSKNVKSTQITAEQYLKDQLDKHIVADPLEDILNQIENQTPMNHIYTQNKQLKTLKMELIWVTHKKAWQQILVITFLKKQEGGERTKGQCK